MSSQQAFYKAILQFSSGAPSFHRGVRMDFCVTLCAKSNSAPSIGGKAELSGAGLSGCSALCNTLHSHALPSTSALDLLAILSIKVEYNVSLITIFYLFQFVEECEILSTPGNMRPSGYYA